MGAGDPGRPAADGEAWLKSPLDGVGAPWAELEMTSTELLALLQQAVSPLSATIQDRMRQHGAANGGEVDTTRRSGQPRAAKDHQGR